jgi:hypothetical protein
MLAADSVHCLVSFNYNGSVCAAPLLQQPSVAAVALEQQAVAHEAAAVGGLHDALVFVAQR